MSQRLEQLSRPEMALWSSQLVLDLTELLSRSIERGDAEGCGRVLSTGIAVDGAELGARRPLQVAIAFNQQSFVRTLLSRGARADAAAIRQASDSVNIEALVTLLDAQASSQPGSALPLQEMGFDTDAMMRFAAAPGITQAQMARVLAEVAAQAPELLVAVDADGRTALDFATYWKREPQRLALEAAGGKTAEALHQLQVEQGPTTPAAAA
jgi:hypothetical protein